MHAFYIEIGSLKLAFKKMLVNKNKIHTKTTEKLVSPCGRIGTGR